MKKRKPPLGQQGDWIESETYDCGDVPTLVQHALDQGRRPTEADLARVLNSTSTQICVFASRLRAFPPSPVRHNWEDCLGYALLLATVGEKAAEQNCPKKRWLSSGSHSSQATEFSASIGGKQSGTND